MILTSSPQHKQHLSPTFMNHLKPKRFPDLATCPTLYAGRKHNQ